jgi:hypothetical protein
MVRLILQKSEENEEEEAKKEDVRKKARMLERESKKEDTGEQPTSAKEDDDSDLDIIEADEADSDDGARTTTTGSYVKVKDGEKETDDAVPEDDKDGPDVYDVNVLAWDLQCSPLHLAILKGHTDVVKELVQSFGADVLLPVKLFHEHDKSPKGAILTLVLSLSLPLQKAKEMTKVLLSLGATSAQADTKQVTALHYVSVREPVLLETMIQDDEPAASHQPSRCLWEFMESRYAESSDECNLFGQRTRRVEAARVWRESVHRFQALDEVSRVSTRQYISGRF